MPDFFYHLDEDEDPVPCFAMTNPYEAILTHDPARTCVHVSPDMLHSFKPLVDPPLESDQGINIWYPQGSGKTHIHQMGLWSIMSDRPSYTIHPQPSGISGSGCMDFCIDRLNHQAPLDEVEAPLSFEGIEPTDYLIHQPDTTTELNINRSYDDLLDVSTTLGTDLVQRTGCIQCTDLLSNNP